MPIRHRHRGLIRLLRVVRLLAEPVTVDDMAARLACTRRTVYRDLEVLKAVGFPLRKVGRDRHCLARRRKAVA